MKNYFEELNEKGITEVDLSADEVRNLLEEGRITLEQAKKCFIQMVGPKKFYESFYESLKESYANDKEN